MQACAKLPADRSSSLCALAAELSGAGSCGCTWPNAETRARGARKKLSKRSEETKLTESEKDRQSASQLTEPLLELRAEATVDWAWLRSGVLATAGRLAVNAKAFLTYVLLYT